MPYQYGASIKGSWVRWGDTGERYYYKAGSAASKAAAFAKASEQRKAIEASKGKQDASPATRSTPEERARRTIAMMKAAGHKFNRRRKTYRIRYPKIIEMEYARKIRGMVSAVYGKAAQLIIDDLPHIEQLHHGDMKLDAAGGDALKRSIRKAEAVIDENLRASVIEQTAVVYAQRVGVYNGNEMTKRFVSKLGVAPVQSEPWLQPKIENWIDSNTALIADIKARQLKKVRDTVRTGLDSGRLTKDMAAEIQGILGEEAAAHATLIARDQIGKLFGDLTKERDQEIGITRFIWRTAGDERVRDSHDALEGQEFTWAEGAEDSQTGETIWPGTAIQCRCTSEPIFDEMQVLEEEQ